MIEYFKGDKVRITNKDSDYYGEICTIQTKKRYVGDWEYSLAENFDRWFSPDFEMVKKYDTLTSCYINNYVSSKLKELFLKEDINVEVSSDVLNTSYDTTCLYVKISGGSVTVFSGFHMKNLFKNNICSFSKLNKKLKDIKNKYHRFWMAL